MPDSASDRAASNRPCTSRTCSTVAISGAAPSALASCTGRRAACSYRRAPRSSFAPRGRRGALEKLLCPQPGSPVGRASPTRRTGSLSANQRRHLGNGELNEPLLATIQTQVLVSLGDFLVVERGDLAVQQGDRGHDEAHLDAVRHHRNSHGDATQGNAQPLALLGAGASAIGLDQDPYLGKIGAICRQNLQKLIPISVGRSSTIFAQDD